MVQSNENSRVPTEKLRWVCPPDALGFDCTEELQPLSTFVGQERALRAVEFGLELDKPGYNLFVTGLTGTGKTSAIQRHLRQLIEQRKEQASLDDWSYVYGFQEPDRPQVLKLPAGQGKTLRRRVTALLAEIREAIPQAFSSSEYAAQQAAVTKEGQERQQQLQRRLEEEVNSAGFALQSSPTGFALLPLGDDGKPLEPEAYRGLPQEQRQAIEAKQPELAEQIQQTAREVMALQREMHEKISELNRHVGEFHLEQEFRGTREAFGSLPDVVQFLEDLKAYALDHLALFQAGDQQATGGPPPASPSPQGDPFLPFQVNVMVDNGWKTEPPVVLEPNPTWSNLFGTIERRGHMGTYFSDHTLLKAGAFHRANGGYLIVNARYVLTNPAVWEGIKRVIRNQEVRLEDPTQQSGFLMPQGLRPQPIAADLKVIVVGDEQLYRALSVHDREDFWEMFKVKAEFDSQIDATEAHLQEYAAFICGICRAENLRHFDRTGVARVAEHGARIVSDQAKLSTRFGQLKDVLIEAEYWARKDDAALVTGVHVQKAVEERVYRLNLVEERMRELIAEGTIMVDVEGEVVGQVNGLAVYQLGDFAFGRPSRITAKTFAGRRGVINIERESQLSGRTHDKGMLILSGYLGHQFAQDRPLSLSASVCFEQSYDGVDGDSASSTELYAILSSLSGLPTRQGVAVTGSVNQQGEIQPIGGVNQKVEGFFDVCRVQGLTGEQGVLIPHQNVKNLMLREDVVRAVEEGKFNLWSVRHIDEGIEILTGTPAGEQRPDRTYPEGTVNYRVQQRLAELSESLRGFYAAVLEESGSG
jgi:predicted ATP-dependent protease